MNQQTTIFFLIFSFVVLATNVNTHAKSNNIFLWSAEKNGHTIHLFGIIHLPFSLENIMCADTILEKIKNSDLIFMEHLYSKKEINNLFLQEVNTLHSSEDGHEFESLTPEVQDFLKQKNILNTNLTYMGYVILLKYAMGQETLSRFDPSSIGSMDTQIKRIATSQNTQQEAFDSDAILKKLIEEQIADMQHLIYKRMNTDTVGITELETAVYEYPSSISVQNQGVKYLIRKYMANDTQFFSTPPPKNIKYKLVSKQRNQEWLSKLTEAHHNYKSIFIVVGTGHLVEQNNLTDMLAQQGFTVNQFTCNLN